MSVQKTFKALLGFSALLTNFVVYSSPLYDVSLFLSRVFIGRFLANRVSENVKR